MNLLVGWDAIARFLGVSSRKVRTYSEDLQNKGVVWSQCTSAGRSMCAYDSELSTWAKGRKNFCKLFANNLPHPL